MKNRILKFSVCNQHISSDDICVVADSKNYLMALFNFDPTWEGVIKTAVFSNGDNVYNMLLTDDMCRVPAEVVCGDGFFVSVFGGDLITADKVKVSVTPSGMVAGVAPPEPTPSVYDQMLTLVATEAAAAEGSADAAEQSAQSAALSAETAAADKQALFSANTLWVFDGGNSSNEVYINQVIDSEMSDMSENAVQNKVIKAFVEEITSQAKSEAVEESDAAFSDNLDELTSDYVIAQGKDSATSLYFRKWKNGTAECWGTMNYSGVVTAQLPSGRYCSNPFSKDFPSSLFCETPYIIVSPKYAQKNFEIQRVQWSYANKSNTGNYRVLTEEKIDTALSESFNISLYAVGVWK